MLKRLSSFVVVLSALFVVASFASIAQAQDKKADATGTWKWSTPGRNGGAARESTLNLKQDGEKLTGTISGGRNDIEISDGKVAEGKVTFKVVRKGQNGQEMTMTYEGKLDGDTIKGTVTMDRNGTPQAREWEAKREVAKPATPAAPAAQ